MKRRPLYIETTIKASLDSIWEHTQDPAKHRQWDLRFTDIEYLPKASPADPQQFRYQTRIGFGLAVSGEGESVGDKTGVNGKRTSVLISPIGLNR